MCAGYRKADLEAVMAAGKLPLIDAESLALVTAFRAASVDCLPLFLQPPSHDAYAARVDTWLQETPHALAQYDAAARRQAADVMASHIYDEVLVNAKLHTSVEGAVEIVRKYRPDLFKDVSTGEDDPYAKEPWRAVCVVYVAGHAALSRRDALLARMLELLPDKFASLPESTTRKASKDEVEGRDGFFGVKGADLQKAKDEGRVLTWRQQGPDIYCRTVDAAAAQYAKSGLIALLPLGDEEAAAMVQAGLRHDIAVVHVRRSSVRAITAASLQSVAVWLSADMPTDCKHHHITTTCREVPTHRLCVTGGAQRRGAHTARSQAATNSGHARHRSRSGRR